MSDTLPPLVQEYRAKADDLLDAQKKIRESTKQTASETTDSSEKSKRGWLEVAKGTLAAEVAMKALGAASRALTSVISTGIQEAKDAAAGQAQLEAGIASTGNAANVTIAGMNALAAQIQAYSGQTDDSITKTQSLLLTFTKIRNVGPDRIFDDATRAAADMAARLGGDAASQAMLLGKALNDPVKGISALTRVGVTFTQAQKDQVAAMVAAGDTIGAQQVILANLQEQFGGSAEAAGRTFPGAIERAKRAFEDLSQGVVESFLPVVTPAINAMVDALQKAAPIAQGVSDRIAGALQNIGPAIDVIRNVMSGIDPSRLGEVSPVLVMIGELFRSVADAARPIWEQIKAGFAQLAPVFGPLIAQVAQLWMQFSPLQMILKAVTPVLPTLISAFVQLATTVGGVLGTTLQQLMPILSQVAGLLAGELAKIAVQLAPIIAQLATSLGNFLGRALEMVAPLLVKLAEFAGQVLTAAMPLVDVVLQLVSAFLPLLDPILQLVSALLPPLVDLISMLLSDAVMPLVSGFLSALVPALQLVAQIATSILIPAVKMIVQVLTGVIDFVTGVFTGNWSKAWSGIVKIFSGIFTGIKGIVAGVINTVIGIINGVISGVNGIAGAVKDATGGAINIHIGSIPRVSFDIGTERVPGAKNAPLPAVVHGGEAILSNDMIEGRERIPSRVTEAVDRERGSTGPRELLNVGGSSKTVIVHAKTDASPARIARDVGWELDRKG